MVLAYVLYGNDVLKRIFKLGKYEKVNENSITQINNKISGIKIISNEENKEKEIENQKENENENERDIISQNKMIDSKIDKNEGSLKYSKIEDNKDSIQSNDNVNILSNNNINSNKIDVSNIENNKKENANNSFSISENNNINNSNKDKAGIKKEETSYKNNPPKKKEERKNDSMFTKTNNEDKDLISSDISFSKRFKEDYNNSEISFDKISKEKPIYIDNLVNPGEMLENNYLDFPLNFEKNMIISIYRNALELNEEENDDPVINNMLYHYDTFEDYYEPQSEENNDKNNVRNMKAKKLKKKKNHKVIKLLDGDDTFIKSEKNYESDNYYDKNNNNKK
jgi:histone acetyltransferase